MSVEAPWERVEDLDQSGFADEERRRRRLMAGDYEEFRVGDSLLEVREPLVGLPERLFTVVIDGVLWGGYKTVSDYVVEHDMPGVFCSRVYAHNLLGPVVNFRVSEGDARVVTRTVDDEERRSAFSRISATTEITYPFPKYSAPGTEKRSAADGWRVSEERAQFLAMGEDHLRAYTHQRLASRLPEGRQLTAFDPACSTGRFLSEFAEHAPVPVRTIGQDLSEAMVGYAAKVLDEVHHGDARSPAVEPGSVDVLFSRFLNSEVVTVDQARTILPSLVSCLRPGGLFVMFGHSPVLLDTTDLEAAGLVVEQVSGHFDGAVFQYVIARDGR